MNSLGFKKLFPVIIGAILLISLFTAVIISQQRQDLRQRAEVSQTQPLGTLNSEGTPTPSPSLTQTAAISPPPGGPIGYIGCSNSRGTVSGYHAVGGTRFWPPILGYGGGTIVVWKDQINNPTSGKWNAFKNNLALKPTSTIWISVCLHPQESDQEIYDSAVAVINETRRLIPGATIYISAINGFVSPHICGLTGADGPDRANALSDRLTQEGKALRGPRVGDLLSIHPTNVSTGATAQNNQTADDGCHPNDAGERFLGTNLLNFFSSTVPSVSPTVSISPTSTPLTPTPTLGTGTTALSLNLLLHGLGKGGDNANPNAGGNTNPLRPQRNVKVEVFNSHNQLALTKDGIVSFNSANGNFTGNVSLGTAFATGVYTVKIKSDQFLRSLVPGIQTITTARLTSLPQTILVTGDMNGDNKIDILDYNVLIDCYSDFRPAINCSDPAKKLSADITDDGNVNQFDYNLFLRELTNIAGE